MRSATSITGTSAGRTRASTARPSSRSPRCYARRNPRLIPLPVGVRYYRYGKRTVHLDGHVEVERAYYSARRRAHQSLFVRVDERRVHFSTPSTRELLREHVPQAPGRRRTREEDKPKKTPLTTVQVLSRARVAGRHIGALAGEIHRREGENGVRSILGLLGLAKKHGPFAVDDASAMALSVGVANYQLPSAASSIDNPPAALTPSGRSAHPRSHALPRHHPSHHQGTE